jgi:hypothetical protein
MGGVAAAGGITGAGGLAPAGGSTAGSGSIGVGGRLLTAGTGATGGASGSGGRPSSGGTSGTCVSSGNTGTGGSPGTGGTMTPVTCPTLAEDKFSFFLLSHAALQKDSGSSEGYGGDLGGLAGADAICQRVAEGASACQVNKTWRAFLSTATVDARDRIGQGPWYDRLGRLLAVDLTQLLTLRPTGADLAIVNDLPNESGIPNHNPDMTGNVDNHEILTGTGLDGRVYRQEPVAEGGQDGGIDGAVPGSSTACGPDAETWTVEKATCWAWTSKEPQGCPRVGHSWPRKGSGWSWISVWNEGGCAPGGTLEDTGGLDGTRRVGSAGGYGGFYCFAVTGS